MSQDKLVVIYRWISWHFLPWELEGITAPCCLLIDQYPHCKTLLPSSSYGEKCHGIHLYLTFVYNDVSYSQSAYTLIMQEAMRRLLMAMLCLAIEDDSDEEDSGPTEGATASARPTPRAM